MKQLLVFSVLVLLGSGCKKQAVEPAGCEYIATIPLFNNTYTYRFDAANRLTYSLYAIGSNLTDYVYTYQGNQATIEATYRQNSYVKTRYDLTLNGQGYVVAAQKTNATTFSGTTGEKIQYTHTFGYDAEGHLTSHRADLFAYPFGKPKQTETFQEQLVYQDGNPVRITYTYETDYNTSKRSGTITNQYGTQANLLKIPVHLEVKLAYNFQIDDALLPLLGKPPRALLTRSKVAQVGAEPALDSTRYEYQLDAKGQVLRATQQPGKSNAYSYNPAVFVFDNRCP